MARTSKPGNELGPQPAARDYLPGRNRPAYGNVRNPGVVSSGPLADGVASHNRLGAGQLAQAHVVAGSPVPGLLPVDSPQHLDLQGAIAPEPAAELVLQVPRGHEHNALYSDAQGAPPKVRLEMVDAARASSGMPSEIRSAPGGAAALGTAAYQGEQGVAMTNVELPAHQTPQGEQGSPVVHMERLPGYLQGPAPQDVGAPGQQWAVRPPGAGYSASGGFPR
jgi:hypothetical protein